MAQITIGKLAKAVGVGVETVRFYEKEGLMPQAERLASGYRTYDENSLVRLKFIQKAKNMGFTLKETKEFLELSVSSEADCGDTCNKADEKIADIELRIKDLTAIKKALVKLRTACPGGDASLDDCTILRYFSGKDA